MSEELAHIRRRLKEEGQKTAAYFQNLPEDAWQQQIYQTGSQWRVSQVLAHFISAERAYQRYLGEALAGGRGAPQDMDIDSFNEAEVPTIQGEPFELIEKFRQVRIDTIQLVDSLEPADLTRVANHPWFDDKQVGWYLKLLYRHNTMHRMDIRKALRMGSPLEPTDEHKTGRQVTAKD
jgi:hypothetical protein